MANHVFHNIPSAVSHHGMRPATEELSGFAAQLFRLLFKHSMLLSHRAPAVLRRSSHYSQIPYNRPAIACPLLVPSLSLETNCKKSAL